MKRGRMKATESLPSPSFCIVHSYFCLPQSRGRAVPDSLDTGNAGWDYLFMKSEDGSWPTVPPAAVRHVSVGRSLASLVLKGLGRGARRGAIVSVVLPAWLALGVAAELAANAAPAEPVVAASAAGYTAELNFQETDEVLISRPIGIKLQSVPFPKEPALPGQNVFRGSLLWGQRPELALAFIWDKGRGRLWLDLNRNRDFTDDPKGVFASVSRDNSQCFTNIHLVLPTATGGRPVRLQLTFNSYGGANINVYAGLSSFWQGRINPHGREWQFGLVEGFQADSGSLPLEYVLLRAWAERQRPFNLLTWTPDFYNYTKSVFFDGRAYELDCRYEPGGEAPKYRVAFKELAPKLGELQVTGTDLHRLILTAKSGMTVLLDDPSGTVKLPTGSYSVDEVWLRKGEVEVMRLHAGRVTVEAPRPATLVAGGPLTNSVEVRSAREALYLNYKLLGAGGGAYQFPRPDYEHPPEFAVFQGTHRLGGDKFRFG